MKALHRPDLFGWSSFDAARNVDFHGLAWIRPEGNVLVDPMPMGSHDLAHLVALGGAEHVIVTNSDHVRAAADLRRILGARIHGPAAERDGFPIACDEWLADGDEPVPGMVALALDGSKTPGELALLIDGHTLVTGDLVRAHQGGRLMLLPDAKLADKAAAVQSLRRLAELPDIDAVLVGDGWPVFRDGHARLIELLAAVADRGTAG
ncbi:MAG: MBL fold metallo-hydrolase [Alphaproteobacteria bacterium]|nr:MBL fold metallo-hydrolase [Alphaproteobacteria bacterium]